MNALNPDQIKVCRCGGRLNVRLDYVLLTLVPQPDSPGRYQLLIQRLKPNSYVAERVIFNDIILDDLDAFASMFTRLRDEEERWLHNQRRVKNTVRR